MINKAKYIFLTSIAVLLVLMTIVSCKTTKKREDVSKFGKFYQNTNSYYNGYFNANEIYQNVLFNFNQQHKDNYQRILALYPYMDIENPKSQNTDLDKVIEKMGRDINLHRAADWVDDCYLMIGKAQFLKQDYEKAQKTFEYFYDQMNPAFKNSKSTTKIKESKKKTDIQKDKEKKKKAKEKAKAKAKAKSSKSKKSSANKNNVTKKDSIVVSEIKPVIPKNEHVKGTKKSWETYNEALLWMARTYVERDRYHNANFLLQRLDSEHLSDGLTEDVNVFKAFFALKQKNYEEAANSLKKAVEYSDQNKHKARYTFILGQIYQKLNRPNDAYEMFKKVGKYKPDYDLEFNAKLKQLENYKGDNQNYAKKELEKFLKEEKYLDYKDIIYYTIAEAAFNNKNITEALEYYNKSLRANTNNPHLKAECYYRLGMMSFENQKFVLAKNYLDSTLVSLSKNDERYLDISNLASNLKEIAVNLENITLQDSLIRISQMSKEDQKSLATSIRKKQLEEEEKRKKQEKENAKKSSLMHREGAISMAEGSMMDPKGKMTNSSFFAYNEAINTAGKIEFRKNWGAIRLEDDWRRSNKSGTSISEENNPSSEEFQISESELNSILSAVPKNEEQLANAQSKIKFSMLQLGILYREKLKDYQKSSEILENLISKYPGFEEECKAMYYLQMSYIDLGQKSKAENIVVQMSSKYPECTYTKILTDPEFLKNINLAENSKSKYYNAILEDYNKGDYNSASTKIQKAPGNMVADTKYQIKLDLLKAKLKGNLEGKDAYILALEDFTKQYPDSPESVNVRETLRFLKGDQNAFNKLIYTEGGEDFVFEEDKMHYIIVLVKNVDNSKFEQIKGSIAEYCNKNYKEEKLKLSNIYLDNNGTDQIILLRKFDTATQSLQFYNQVLKDKSIFVTENVDYELFSVSQRNYREIIKQKTLDSYRSFFQKAYLKKDK